MKALMFTDDELKAIQYWFRMAKMNTPFFVNELVDDSVLKKVKYALSVAPPKISVVQCPDCNGTGAVGHAVDISDWCPCPMCDGTGEVEAIG